MWFFFRYLSFLLVICLIILEVSLRLTGVFDTYFEKVGQGISLVSLTVRGSLGDSWNYSRSPHDTFLVDHGEFRYTYHTNSLGLRERKEVFPEDSSVFRVLALGDSYTEGVGAPADSSWPSFLEKYLRPKNVGGVEVYNAGVSGSDPFYNYKMLETSLIDLKPNLVIQAFNSTDMDDFILRGGMERFQPNNSVAFPPLPWWEPCFRFSHVFRGIVFSFGYNHFLVKESEMDDYRARSVSRFISLANKYDSLAQVNNFKVCLALIPEPYFLSPSTIQLLLLPDLNPSEKVVGYGHASKYRYLQGLQQADTLQNLSVIDLLPSLSDTISDPTDYSWPIDGHYNGRGYDVIGHVLSKSLLE